MGIEKKRLNYYNPYGTDPESTGLIANDKDFDFGTPNLERQEDVSFIAANSSLNTCLLVRIKWRPSEEKQLVTVISKMTLHLDSKVLEFEQIETYKPSESSLRPGRYTQYGSGASKLKLYVPQPYRRMRLVFNGLMRQVDGVGGGAADDGAAVFVKLACIVNFLTEPFDFLEQYDENCLKQIYADKRPVRTLNQVVSNLLLHDRHELKVRLAGECLVIDSGSNSRRQTVIGVHGFYGRHFLSASAELSERNITTRRLFSYMNNGQSFHIGTRKSDLDQVDFGYTSFMILPRVSPIQKPYKLDWQQLEGDSNEFKLEISGQGLTFESHGVRNLGSWFKVETNGKPGWAWVSHDDELVSSQDELEAIARSHNELKSAISSGALALVCHHEGGDETRPLVVSTEEDSCSDSKLVGSKASSLAQLTKLCQATDKDYQVPFALVLTKFAHDLILEENPSLRDSIAALQRSVGEGSQLDGLRDQCKLVAELVAEKTKLPTRIVQDLCNSLAEHYGASKIDGDEISFAVRSSSWGEDEDDMSAAGQLSTILWVKFNENDLTRAIMSCFASKFNHENIEYKRQHGLPLDLPMAVVVQEMVHCQKAGVMFTCDPTTGNESVITITANYGLGESVVSAQADPDSIRVRTNQCHVKTIRQMFSNYQPESATLEIENITIGQKNVITSSNMSDQQVDKSKCCLSEGEILHLAKCGLKVKHFFWFQRRDIEWGFNDGRLFLFQSRPVTGLETFTNEEIMHEADRPSQAELSFYTRANIGEVMPYAIRPLTLSTTIFAWNITGARMVSKYTSDFFYVPQCGSEVFQEKYHSFFNLRCSMLLPLSEAKRSVLGKAMEISFFGREMGVQPEIIEASKGFERLANPFHGSLFELRNIPLKLMPNRIIMREKYLMDSLRIDMRNSKLISDYGDNKLYALYSQLIILSRHLHRAWENHLNIIMFATDNNMVLSSLLARYIQDPMQLSAALNKFLAISPDVISAEIPARVETMAKLVEARGQEELKRFIAMRDEEALAYMRCDSAKNEQLRRQFEAFLEHFGHRCYNEFELAEFSWREKPEEVAEMVRRNCSALAEKEGEPDSTTGAEVPSSKRPKTIDEVIESLNVELSLKHKLLIKYKIAPKCQQLLAMREKTKSVLVLHADTLREACRMLAEEMQRQLRIPDKDLLYYLMFDELMPLVRQHQPAIVCQAIRRRQMFKRSMSEPWKFDEIISEVTPNHMKPTKELDEALARAPKLLGTPASSGKAQAKICLVNGYKELDKVRAGDILLTHSTDIAFSPVFPLVAGIITEVGGLISHGAVVAREYGLPSVIGIPDVTRILQDGEEVILDADNGAIIRLSKVNGIE